MPHLDRASAHHVIHAVRRRVIEQHLDYDTRRRGGLVHQHEQPLQHTRNAVDAALLEGSTELLLDVGDHGRITWAIEQGFTPKLLQALLGHASIQMTFDVYGHLFPSLEDDHAKFAAGELAIAQ
jgi:integrase